MSGEIYLRNQMYLEELDKLWGHFRMVDNGRSRRGWCWWANVGKSISIQPIFDDFKIRKLEKTKINNGYQVITKDDLMLLWPSFINDLNDRLIFEMLAND